jgi:hypothetical protein
MAAVRLAEARPCSLQMPLGPKANETASFKDLLPSLRGRYGRGNTFPKPNGRSGKTLPTGRPRAIRDGRHGRQDRSTPAVAYRGPSRAASQGACGCGAFLVTKGYRNVWPARRQEPWGRP